MPMSRRSQRARSGVFFQRRSNEQVPKILWMRERGGASPHTPLLLDAGKSDLVYEKKHGGQVDSSLRAKQDSYPFVPVSIPSPGCRNPSSSADGCREWL